MILLRFLKKERNGRVNICLFTKEIINGRIDERNSEVYCLYLTDREISFPTYECHRSHSRLSLDGRPVISLS